MPEKNLVKKKKILIAENDTTNLEFLKLMLSKLGFEIFEAGDGEEAISIVENEELDLVLTNTMLPKVSGWEILKTIRADKRLQVVPVIFLSDIDNVIETVEAYELGVEDFITKPFNFSVMLVRIRSALRKKEFYEKVTLIEKQLLHNYKTGKEIKIYADKLLNDIKNLKEELAPLKNRQTDKQIELIEETFIALQKSLSTYLPESEEPVKSTNDKGNNC